MDQPALHILILSKRQYTNKDLLDDRFGRLREIPFALAQRGHKVQGLCLSYAQRDEGWLWDGPVGWKSINATVLKLPGLLKFIREARYLAKRVDAIWACSDSFYGIMAHFIGLRYGVPTIFDLYDNFEYFMAAKLPVVKQLYYRAVRRSDAVTCVSEPLVRLVNTYGRFDNVYVLENAVRDDLFKPIDRNSCRIELKLPQNALVIGTAGALDKNRGIDCFFEAFAQLRKRHSDLHLALAGPRARGLQVPKGPYVHDFGTLALEDVPQFLNSLDVAVICNLDNDFGRYCFPQKAREIMACNVPLVAANVGSMSELLEANPEWLYTPGDSTDLARVLENRLADRGTDYKGINSWAQAAASLEEILLNICRRNK